MLAQLGHEAVHLGRRRGVMLERAADRTGLAVDEGRAQGRSMMGGGGLRVPRRSRDAALLPLEHTHGLVRQRASAPRRSAIAARASVRAREADA